MQEMNSLSLVYQQHKNQVYNLALHYVVNKEDAEEIMQDVFVKVFDNYEKFRKESSLKTWIYRITINQSLDFLKAKNASKRKSRFGFLRIDDYTVSHEIPVFDHPGVLLEQKEAIEKIYTYIYGLPENQQTVLILLRIEQLPMTEVAGIMKLSVKAIDSLYQRAKKKIEKKINQDED